MDAKEDFKKEEIKKVAGVLKITWAESRSEWGGFHICAITFLTQNLTQTKEQLQIRIKEKIKIKKDFLLIATHYE